VAAIPSLPFIVASNHRCRRFQLFEHAFAEVVEMIQAARG